MKKMLLILAIVSLSAIAFGQQKQKPVMKTKTDTTKVVDKKTHRIVKESVKPMTDTVKKDTVKVKKDVTKIKK